MGAAEPQSGRGHRPRIPRPADGARCRAPARGPAMVRLGGRGACAVDRDRPRGGHLRLRRHPRHAGHAGVRAGRVRGLYRLGVRGQPAAAQHLRLRVPHLRAADVWRIGVRLGQ